MNKKEIVNLNRPMAVKETQSAGKKANQTLTPLQTHKHTDTHTTGLDSFIAELNKTVCKHVILT